jgi:hypothetical protein
MTLEVIYWFSCTCETFFLARQDWYCHLAKPPNVINHKNDFFSHNLMCLWYKKSVTHRGWAESHTKNAMQNLWRCIQRVNKKDPVERIWNSRPSSKKLNLYERDAHVSLKMCPVDDNFIPFLFPFIKLHLWFFVCFLLWVIGVEIGIWSIFKFLHFLRAFPWVNLLIFLNGKFNCEFFGCGNFF